MKYIAGVFIGSIIWSTVLAVEEALPGWAQYGILGVVVIALVVTKQLVPGWIYADVRRENDELKVENKRLVQVIIDNQAISAPALAKSTEVIDKAMAELHRRGVT